MWSITVEASSLTVFHSKFTCAGLWATELDGRRWFVAAGGSWEFHIIRSICTLRKTCKCEMQLHKRSRAKASSITELWFDIYITSVSVDFFPGQVDTIGCWADDFTWNIHIWWMQIQMKASQESQQNSCVSWTFDDCKHFIEKCHKKANKHFLRFTNSSHLIVTLSLHSIFGGSWLLVRGQRLE